MSEERCKVAVNASAEQLMAALAFLPTVFLLEESTLGATLFVAEHIIVGEGDDPYDHITLTLDTH